MNPNRKNADAPSHRSLANELIQLNDDFAEFCDVSAFINNALATALKDPECLNGEIASGAWICSNWLQCRCGELKDDIRHVQARYLAESAQTAGRRKVKPKTNKSETQNKEARHA